jgi:hypothetical protein
MHNSLKKAIRVFVLICFAGTQTLTARGHENLSPWLLSDSTPERSGKNYIARVIKPGAIGNGLPLIDLLKGSLPPEISYDDPEKMRDTHRKLREAVNLAIELYTQKRDEFRNISPLKKEWNRTETALDRLNSILNNLSEQVCLYHAPVISEESYLLGFNYYSNYLIGLDADLIDRLYAVSVKRLAQYVYHECIPEHMAAPGKRGKDINRYDHRKTYQNIQREIFGQDEVEALKNDLRAFINEKLAGPQKTGTYVSRAPVEGEKRSKDILRLIRGISEIMRFGGEKIPPGFNKFSFIRPIKLGTGYVSGMYNIYGSWEFNSPQGIFSHGNYESLLFLLIRELGSGISLMDDSDIEGILETLHNFERHDKHRTYHNYNQCAVYLLSEIKDPAVYDSQARILLDWLDKAPQYASYESVFESVKLAEFLESFAAKDKRASGILTHLYLGASERAKGMLYPSLERMNQEGFITKELFDTVTRPAIVTMDDMFKSVAGRYVKVTYSEDDENCPHNQFCYTVMAYGPDGRIICEGGLNIIYRVFDQERYAKMGSPRQLASGSKKDRVVYSGSALEWQTKDLVNLLSRTSGDFAKRAIDATAISIYEGQIDLGIQTLLGHYPGAPFELKLNILRVIERLETPYTDDLVRNIADHEDDPKTRYLLKKWFSSGEGKVFADNFLMRERDIKNAMERSGFPYDTTHFDFTEHEIDVIEAMENLTAAGKSEAYGYFVDQGKISKTTFDEYMRRSEMYLDHKAKTILRWAAMLHDLGKGRGLDSRIPHPQISADIARSILPGIGTQELDDEARADIVWLVKNHDILGNIDTAERAARCLSRELEVLDAGKHEKMLFLLQLMVLADMKGTKKGMFLSDEKAAFYLDLSTPEQLTRREAMLADWRIRRWTGKKDGSLIPEKEKRLRDLIDQSDLKEKIDMAFGRQINYVANAFYTVTELSAEELFNLMKMVAATISEGMDDLSLEFTKPRGNPQHTTDELKNILNGASSQKLGITFEKTGEKEGKITVDTGALKTQELAVMEKKRQKDKKEFFTDLKTMVRAQRLKQNLISIFEKDPERIFIIGLDSDIGDTQRSQIMPVMRVIDQLQRMLGPDGKPAFPNLKIVRKSGEDEKLSDEMMKMIYDHKDKKLKFHNALMIVSETNYKNDEFSGLPDEIWKSVIYEHGSTLPGENSYLPVLEAVTLTAMAALNADIVAIKEFYDEIAKDPVTSMPVTEYDLRAMLGAKTILILPRMTRIPVEDLLVIYSTTRTIYLAA